MLILQKPSTVILKNLHHTEIIKICYILLNFIFFKFNFKKNFDQMCGIKCIYFNIVGLFIIE